LLADLDFVLVMSVNPGYSAQKFISSAIDKIRELSALRAEKGLKYQIEVDGGVKGDNAAVLRDAGTDILVSASYIFASENYTNAINTLKGI
ncbi:MAG TPA: ribulose-phosphate 3-epimerase, partial [Candidatus Cloacimonadota bacterium]|nr:ribulose-phosphate 3-epimerase [Candidatus Cloacimonadota bacterium]